MNKRNKIFLFIALLIFAISIFLFGPNNLIEYYHALRGRKTVEMVLNNIGSRVDLKYSELFIEKGASYPPSQLMLIAYKQNRRLELWTKSKGRYIHIQSFDILGVSGQLGPKLIEGDRQIPEGIYKVIGLNPNSHYHLSLKLDYPNQFDKAKALIDGRTELGGNIFIHGDTASIGCLAMGDEVAEDLFVLTARAGKENVNIVISPNDKVTLVENLNYPSWTAELYRNIRNTLNETGIKSSF
ncbi:L,D-transpeptidase family protein [Leptospira wolffii]|uniref:L,D-transpeptidase family protein n=1 Tax=Leptospira wolffii TaxID=409998 RepID=UPI0002FB87B6|nr:L,D-transpeptidase family protein [Leptospira wolffii]EPG65872.1 L,D-transpeptidase catalytic domain protein [Leptospira wolffii serovar Khorat str. Khorat-H2]